MDFDQFIAKETRQINQALDQYLKNQQIYLSGLQPQLKELFSHFIQINQNGKRLRALLVKIGYLMSGGKSPWILDIMLAIEIFHTAILAHDDIVDQSPLRRGQPTMHYALGNDHHAISQTIVLADYGFFLSSQLLAKSRFEEKRKNQAIQIFNQMVLDTAIGEIVDIEIPFRQSEITQPDAEMIALYKTARYTFTGPLQIGAVLGGADKLMLENIQVMGDLLGIAFQIQDDMLGVFGEVDNTGKSNLSDLQEGKVTLLASFAFKKSDLKSRAILKKLYGKKDLSLKEAEQIRQIFQQTKALDFSQKTALKYTESAISKITDLPIDQEYKTILKELADFLMERKK